MKFLDVIKDIQKKLVKIIGTKDVDKRKSMIVNLAAAIFLALTAMPQTPRQGASLAERMSTVATALAMEHFTTGCWRLSST